MKTLIVMRHAKAAPGNADHERALDARGRAEAVWAGEALRATKLQPDVALVSDARRTLETYEGLHRVLGPAGRVVIEPELYCASRNAILGLIRSAPDDAGCVLVVGHNPGLAEAARDLVATGPDHAIADLRARYPTAGIAVIDFACSAWADIGTHGNLKHLLWPDRDC